MSATCAIARYEAIAGPLRSVSKASATCAIVSHNMSLLIYNSEQIHSKKRNRLEHVKLQELVYVKYNNMLRNRRDTTVAYDPISLDDIGGFLLKCAFFSRARPFYALLALARSEVFALCNRYRF